MTIHTEKQSAQKMTIVQKIQSWKPRHPVLLIVLFYLCYPCVFLPLSALVIKFDLIDKIGWVVLIPAIGLALSVVFLIMLHEGMVFIQRRWAKALLFLLGYPLALIPPVVVFIFLFYIHAWGVVGWR